MFYKIPLNQILFLDIETVPQEPNWELLNQKKKELWDKKTQNQRKEKSVQEFYTERAGILAEFGKIICISCGVVTGDTKIRLKSFYGNDEKQVLIDFQKLLQENTHKNAKYLCAHNGKEFDFPYLGRRMLINNVSLPNQLQVQGKKPWDIKHLDTMELWRFGDYKHYTSLDLLTNVLQIPTPKSDIDGSMIAKVYYKEQNLEKIKEYCEKDVIAIVQVLRKFRGEELLEYA